MFMYKKMKIDMYMPEQALGGVCLRGFGIVVEDKPDELAYYHVHDNVNMYMSKHVTCIYQCSPQAPLAEWAPSTFIVCLALMWEWNQLMWPQTPPKPRPPTLP